MKTIGEKIKELRLKNHMTQEQLASCLNVTFQTISKWETGVSSPDLSLIVPITRLFRISADELLGIYDMETDKRYEELKAAYDHTFYTNDMEKRQRICEMAVTEYPGDMKWLAYLAWVVSNRSFDYDDKEKYVAEQEKAIKLFDAVVKNCKDDVIRGDAITGIIQSLGFLGRKEEARRYAEMLPERTIPTRDMVMEDILEGDERIRFKQERMMGNVRGVLEGLQLMQAVYTDLARDIVKTVCPDGNYLIFNHDLLFALEKKINSILKWNSHTSADEICDLLAEMKSYAKAYDQVVFEKPGVYKYTAPWFDHVEEDTTKWLGNEGTPMLQIFREYLEEERFDSLREHARFVRLKTE